MSPVAAPNSKQQRHQGLLRPLTGSKIGNSKASTTAQATFAIGFLPFFWGRGTGRAQTQFV